MLEYSSPDAITLDTDECLLFRNDDLSFAEYNYLEHKKFIYAEFVPIGKTRPEGFLIKKNTRESLGHTFLVHNIKQELEKYGVEVKAYITVKPDLLFRNKKGKTVAIEVETGKQFRRRKQRIKNKFDKAQQKYPLLIVVVTTTKVKQQYKRLLSNTPVLVRTDIPSWIRQQRKNKEL